MFLAASQAQTLSYSIGNYSASLEVAINTITLIGLVCTIFGSFTAYLGSMELLSTTKNIELYLGNLTRRIRNDPRGESNLVAWCDRILQNSPSIYIRLQVRPTTGNLPNSGSIEAMLRQNIVEGIIEELEGRGTRDPDITQNNDQMSTERLSSMKEHLEYLRKDISLHSMSNEITYITRMGIVSHACILVGFFCFWASIICIGIATKDKRIWITVVVTSSILSIVWLMMVVRLFISKRWDSFDQEVFDRV